MLDAELDDAVATGTVRRLVLVGEAGVGKTRLVQEFARRVGRRARVLAGRCVAYGEGVALLPLFQIVGRVGDLDSVLTGEEDASRVAERLRDPAAFDRSEGFWAFRRLLESLARQQPVVVILEDVHWGAGTFLDLVDYLDGWTAAPVLLLCVGRLELLERRPEWRDDGFLLEPLTVLAAHEFAAALPEYGRFGAAAVDRAVELAEGNPLFLEQLLASHTEVVPGAVPPTVEALIAGRLDALEPSERAALERAAVAGRGFWWRVRGRDAGRRAGRRWNVADVARAQTARSSGTIRSRGRGRLPLPPRVDPRRRLRRDPRVDTRGAPRIRRPLAGRPPRCSTNWSATISSRLRYYRVIPL